MNNGKICVSVAAETVDELIENIKRAEEYADVIEVRFDCLRPAEIFKAVGNLPQIEATYLFTYRPKEQGGVREIPFGERLKFWETIFYHHKTNFIIDIEAEPEMMMAIETNVITRILSLHYFNSLPNNLDSLFDVLTNVPITVPKIAVVTNDIVEGLNVWKLIERAKARERQVIPIAMGEAGKWTRILGLAHGAMMTYGSLDVGSETAPGQVTAKDLIDIYRVKQLDLDTKVFGVIGDPVSQSLSTYMHNPAFVDCGINAVFIPLLVKNIDEFMRRMVKMETREVELNFDGFSVTMPHKQSIMKHLDAIDPIAKKIGAVNTVKIEGDKLIGYNTDAHGFITPLKEKFGDLKDTRVAVFGAGGAARACVYALKQENADVTVIGRDPQKTESFGEEFGIRSTQLTTDYRLPTTDFDIVVDTTPLGMKGPFENDSLFTAEQLDGVKFVYDLVTKPSDTPIIREAKKAGIPAIGGLEMLVAQGAMQFEIWTGQTAPLEIMKEAVLNRILQIQK